MSCGNGDLVNVKQEVLTVNLQRIDRIRAGKEERKGTSTKLESYVFEVTTSV
jgi:hypothetical protein